MGQAAQEKIELVFRIELMDCPVEAGEIERALTGMPGLLGMRFDPPSRQAFFTVVRDFDAGLISARLDKLGFPGTQVAACEEETFLFELQEQPADAAKTLALIGENAQLTDDGKTIVCRLTPKAAFSAAERLSGAGIKANIRIERKTNVTQESKPPFVKLGIALAFAAAAEILELAAAPGPAVIALSLAAIALAGCGTILRGARNLLRFTFNMSTLMAVAVIGACLLGSWPEAAMVMALYEIGEGIESLAAARARGAIRSLLGHAPNTVTVRMNGAWMPLPA